MDRYADLRKAIEKSTPGEWSIGPKYRDDEGYVELPIFSIHEGKQLAPMAIALQFPYVRGMQEANAALVVLTRNLVPELLAERDALRDALTACAMTVKRDRDELELCSIDPKTGLVEDDQPTRDALQEYDAVLDRAYGVLAQGPGGSDE